MTEPVISPPFTFSLNLFGRFYLRTYYASVFRPILLILQVLVFVALPIWLNRGALAVGVYGPTLRIVIAALVLVYIVLPPLLMLVAWNRLRKQPTAKGERTVGFTAQTLESKSAVFDVKLDWTAVLKTDRAFGIIIFYTQKQGGIIVPDTAFATPDAAAGFYATARQAWQAAMAPATKSALDA